MLRLDMLDKGILRPSIFWHRRWLSRNNQYFH